MREFQADKVLAAAAVLARRGDLEKLKDPSKREHINF